MRRSTTVVLVVSLAILGIVALGACGGTATTTTTPSTTATTAASTTTASGATDTTGGTTETTWGAGFKPLDPAVKVTVAFDDAPGTAGLILADQMGFFKQVGIQVEWVKFNTGADMYTALAANKVDVGRGITTASLYNGAAQGVRVWVVADSGTNVPGKPNYFGIVVRKDLADQIKDYADLRGRNCLIVSKGSINERFLRLALAKGGLTVDDVTVTIIDSFPDLNTALGNNAADVAVQIEPLITAGEKDDIFVRFAKDAQDYAAGQQVACLLYSDAFAKKADVANAFMVAHLMGVRKYNDAVIHQKGNDMDAVIDLLAKNTFVQDPVMWTTMAPTGVDPDGTVLEKAVADDQQFYADIGMVQKTVPMTDVIDMSFAKYAVQVLGAYEPPK